MGGPGPARFLALMELLLLWVLPGRPETNRSPEVGVRVRKMEALSPQASLDLGWVGEALEGEG